MVVYRADELVLWVSGKWWWRIFGASRRRKYGFSFKATAAQVWR
jgi:hypothetical protein